VWGLEFIPSTAKTKDKTKNRTETNKQNQKQPKCIQYLHLLDDIILVYKYGETEIDNFPTYLKAVVLR
jgi:hypothetical protein